MTDKNMSDIAKRKYPQATNFVCDMVEELIEDGELDFPESTFADAVGLHSQGIRFRQTKSNCIQKHLTGAEHTSYYEIDDYLASHLVEFAREKHEFFDFCAHICATNLLSSMPLPFPLTLFGAKLLKGEISRPNPRHRPRASVWLEQSFLWSLTIDVKRLFDLKLTRNDEVSAQISACDAVAEGLTFCGRKTRYSEIKNLMVHPDKAQLRKEFEATSRMFLRSRSTKKILNALHPDFTEEQIKRAIEDVMDINGTFPQGGQKS